MANMEEVITNDEILAKAQRWTQEPFDEQTREEIHQLIESGNVKELKERFYKNLEFGTGGMRGIMGAGTNRINKYTLGKNTQGLSNYLIKYFPDKQVRVAIAYDCRNNSKEFAQEVANVFSANGIKVYLFKDLRPTPELSFAVRYLKCDAGVVLTASHNPPEYNGYKVYFNDGAQIVPPQDKDIVKEINSLDFGDINFSANTDLIRYLGHDVDQAFTKAAVQHGTFDGTQGRDKIRIVFTPLHGTSVTIIPGALEQAGFTDVAIVEEQSTPDGNFSTVQSPNPEEPAALKMALDLAEKNKADLVIGTDPDSDRIGIAVRNTEGQLRLLNGNQTMVLMTDFLLRKWQEAGKLNGKQFVGSTIVSTDLVNEVAHSYGVETKVGLTGFKWIAKMIRDAEGKQEFVGGGEESFGYLIGDFVRDKDAVTASVLACEIAADAKSKGSSIYEELLKIYQKHRFFKERLISVVKKGIAGAQEIKQMMDGLRQNPKQTIAGSKVVKICDYLAGVCKNLDTGEEKPTGIPKSNVLIYQTADGTKVAARPSGTEPKIKFYFSVRAPLNDVSQAKEVEARLDEKIDAIIKEMGLG